MNVIGAWSWSSCMVESSLIRSWSMNNSQKLRPEKLPRQSLMPFSIAIKKIFAIETLSQKIYYSLQKKQELLL
jgi:hypothetical protein